MTALYSLAEIRAIEHAAKRMLPAGTLMQRAGQAAANIALHMLAHGSADKSTLILAGPGDNGGDALEVAARLAFAGIPVTVLLFADPTRQSADTRQALARAQQSRANFADTADAIQLGGKHWSLIVDGLFGIGLSRPITGELHQLIEQVNRLGSPVLSLDIPSGLDTDSGNVVGQPGIAIQATQTVTFIADKPGLHTGSGRDHVGNIIVESLAIDPLLFPAPQAQLNDVAQFSGCFKRRLHNSHKGSYGDLAVVGGAEGMAGAAILAANAAAHCGVGRTYVALAGPALAYDSAHPELMFRQAQQMDLTLPTLVIGPGLGISAESANLLDKALGSEKDIVIDADALNLIAQDARLRQRLIARAGASILTPHPLEAARLLGCSSAAVQADRLGIARTLARDLNATVILKGSGSIITQPHGNLIVNPTGNPALATAGSGDVLAGICGALLAQGWPAWEAALAATWMHGKAADLLVQQGIGPIGLAASELIAPVRGLLNRLTSKHDRKHS
jgi:hydroxyethylthiazole kinase-like uncharacterized protein yjeF